MKAENAKVKSKFICNIMNSWMNKVKKLKDKRISKCIDRETDQQSLRLYNRKKK